MRDYLIDYGTGAGNDTVTTSLNGAMIKAQDYACYTQKNVHVLTNIGGEMTIVATLPWWGTKAEPGSAVILDYGDFGYYGEWVINEDSACLLNEDPAEDINVLIRQLKQEMHETLNTGEISDGYHTFDELYTHRAILFAVICNANKDKAWKSYKHHDGGGYNGMFLAGIETSEGQYTYHIDNAHYDLFDVKELDLAPPFDGHKPSDITRLLSLVKGE